MSRRGNWRAAKRIAPQPVEKVVEEVVVEEEVVDNDHLLDEDILDEENDHNHEASDGSDSGDDDNPWVSYIESQS